MLWEKGMNNTTICNTHNNHNHATKSSVRCSHAC